MGGDEKGYVDENAAGLVDSRFPCIIIITFRRGSIPVSTVLGKSVRYFELLTKSKEGT